MRKMTVMAAALSVTAAWGAEWIGSPASGLGPSEEHPKTKPFEAPADCEFARNAVWLRKPFAVEPKPVRKATLTVASPCFATPWMDGAPVDPTRILAPAATDFKKHVNEDAYDVTGKMSAGGHMVGIWLAPGYATDAGYLSAWWRWTKPKCVRAELTVEYADGSRTVVGTGTDWQYREETPVVRASIYHGETYDARLDDPNWCGTGGGNAGWVAARKAVVAPAAPVVRTPVPAIRLCDPLKPVSVTKVGDGRFVFDFGLNRAAVPEVRVRGARGTKVTVRTAEEIYPDGTLDVRSNREARSTDEFILAGTGKAESFRPRFTYHGFRYIEVSGAAGGLGVGDATSWAVKADFERLGTFACSDANLMKLYDAAVRGLESNLLAFPSDCCQRGERNPCVMDVAMHMDASAKTFGLGAFLETYRRHVTPRDTVVMPRQEDFVPGAWIPQRCNADWNGLAITLPWTLWTEYGDRAKLAAAYPDMKEMADIFLRQYPDFICTMGYGDWLAPNDGEPKNYFSEVVFVNTALMAWQLGLVAQAAEALGNAADAKLYAGKAEAATRAFNAKFLDGKTNVYGSGRQINYVLPLKFGLVPAERRAAVGANLVKRIVEVDRRKMDVGGFGVRYLADVLCDLGEADLAIELYTQPEYPGFGFMFANGATTLWEQWVANGYMNSHNHAFFAGAGTFLYTHLAGIRPAAPGYAAVEIAPVFAKMLSHASASIRTPKGPVRCAWRRTGSSVELRVTLPKGVKGACRGKALAEGENVLAFADENGRQGLVEWRPKARWCGFNLLGMFISRRHAKPPAHDPKWSRTPGYFPEEDFRWMRDWGFNFARLPLDYRCWIKGNDWDAIDEDELRKLDAAVRLGQKHGIHVQLCLHRAPGYCINPPEEPKDLFRDRDAQRVFLKHWTTLAKRFRGISNDDLSFDLFNEPPWEISSWQPELHDRVCRMAIEAIRKVDPERFIVVDGYFAGQRPVPALYGLHNVGQGMHSYNPHELTHYNAEWTRSWNKWRDKWPVNDGESGRDWLLKNVYGLWDETTARGVHWSVGEFGFYSKAPRKTCMAWIEDNLKIMRERGLGFCLWNLRGAFGVMDSGRTDIAYEDFEGHKLDRELLDLLRKYAQ